MKLSNLLTNASKWTQNCIARDKQGKVLGDINTFYLQRIDKKGKIFYQEFRNEDLAHSFSLHGAVIKCCEPESRDQIIDKLRDAIWLHTGKNYWVAQYNDLPETTFYDIKRILEIANL